MTSSLAIRTAGSRAEQATSRPKLKVLNQEAIRQRARRRNALVFLFIVVLLALFAVAFVHAQLVAGQQDLDAVRSRIAEAEAHRAKVARLVDEASAPDVIVSRAQGLGMVRAQQPVYLDAVSPVRELPTVATYVPSGPPAHLDVAAGVSAPSPVISVGISGSAPVVAAADSQLAQEQLAPEQLAQGQPAEAAEAVAPAASAADALSVAGRSAGSAPDISGPAGGTGTSINGTSVTGTSINGTAVTGTSVNGTSVTGTSVNSTSTAGGSSNGAFGGVSVTTGSGAAADGLNGGGRSAAGVGVGVEGPARSSFAGSTAISGGNGSG
jgi:cell division protein FtsL